MGESAYVEKGKCICGEGKVGMWRRARIWRRMHIWARMGSAGKREVEERLWTRAHIWANKKNSVERFASAEGGSVFAEGGSVFL